MQDCKEILDDVDQKGLHVGHRERMREKFKTHGGKVFASYELLEMLLYYAIPCKDTNPVARRLMSCFSDLEGLSRAQVSEIAFARGIGERTAEFLVGIFELFRRIDESGGLHSDAKIMTKNSVGEFFVDYFKNSKEHRTAALLLDSNMRTLGLIEPYALDFGSGAVQGRPFIDAAVAAHATSVIIAHNHPYGPLFPSVSDRVGNSSVLKDLAVAGITLAEHYIISGEQYVCMMNTDSRLKLSDGDSRIKPTSDAAWWTDEKKSVLCDVLSVVFEEEEARRHTAEISSRFARLCDVFSADFYVLKDIVGQELAAIFLKLFFCIYIRQKTDRFVFGRQHTEEETVEYFRNLIALEPTEKVYIMLYDSRLRPKFCEFVSEGTVDSSNLPPRRLLEIAKRHEAAAVAIAHNHPRSGVAPSPDDIGTTETIKSLFETVGIRFLAHYVVSIDEYCVISEDGVKYKS